MATKTVKEIKIEAEPDLNTHEDRYNELRDEVVSFIGAVDGLFKSKPTNQELGKTLAAFIAKLELKLL